MADSEAGVETRVSHYNYLDGLRGLAAFYVLLHHAYMMVCADSTAGLSLLARHSTDWLYFGQVAVDVFIVLSGFALTLPLVKTRLLTDGLEGFFQRRARRILPPYYAALALSLLLFWLIPDLRSAWCPRWGGCLPVFRPDVLVSHLLLLHNLSPNTLYTVDYPMWSVATEWQIYFVFALLLLPVWRRFGLAAAVGGAFVLGALLDALYPAACFHFLGLFGLGMGGAVIAYGSGGERWRRLPWGTLAAGLAAAFALSTEAWPRLLWQAPLVMDSGVGMIVACALVHCAGGRGMFVRLLQTRWAVGLGAFSYSLYLTHALVLGLVGLVAFYYGASQMEALLAQFFVGCPLALLTAWQFHLLFERPFQAKKEREKASVMRDAVVSPALMSHSHKVEVRERIA